MSLGKPEAMKRHIQTCIKMIALGLDPVSTHVVVKASEELLGSYAKATEAKLLYDADSFIVPARRGEWRRAMVRAYNFFKHADRDPYEILPPEVVNGLSTVNELQTLMNSLNYQGMFLEWPEGSKLYVMMSVVLYPDTFDTEKMFETRPELHEMLEDARHISRDTIRQFMRESLEANGLL